MNDPAGACRCFDQLNLNACLAESVGAYEPGDAPAYNQCLGVTSHDAVSILARSESFRKERLGNELLFFEIGIENHGQVADENTAEPSGPDFAAFEEHETILPRRFEVEEFVGEILVEVDPEFAGNFVLDDDGVAEQAANDGAA